MKVLVDTSVWSAVFRRNVIIFKDVEKKLSSMILNNDVLIIGPIRLKILSGYSTEGNLKNCAIDSSPFPISRFLMKTT